MLHVVTEQVDNIEVARTLHPTSASEVARTGERGLTLWQFLFKFFVKGVAPVVTSKGTVLAHGSASILTSGLGGLMSLMNHAVHSPSYGKHNAHHDLAQHHTHGFGARLQLLMKELSSQARHTEKAASPQSNEDGDKTKESTKADVETTKSANGP